MEWKPVVLRALETLGSEATLADIYARVESQGLRPLGPNWKPKVRQTLQLTAEKVDGGKWSIRAARKAQAAIEAELHQPVVAPTPATPAPIEPPKKPPGGGSGGGSGGGGAAKIRDAFVANLEEVVSAVAALGCDARVMAHVNSDGTVDAAANITTIPLRTTVEAVLVAAGEVLRQQAKGSWISIRLIRPARDDNEEHTSDIIQVGNRYVGILDTHWRRATRYKIPLAIEQAISMENTARKRKKRRAEQVNVRLHWDVRNVKPER